MKASSLAKSHKQAAASTCHVLCSTRTSVRLCLKFREEGSKYSGKFPAIIDDEVLRTGSRTKEHDKQQ